MLIDFINTLTLRRWLAIAAVVGIAVVAGYFLLSSSNNTNKGSAWGALGGENPLDPKQEDKEEVSLLKSADEVKQEQEEQKAALTIGLETTDMQPRNGVLPSGNEDPVTVFTFFVNSNKDAENPFTQIRFSNTGTIDAENIVLQLFNNTNQTQTSAQRGLEINAQGINLVSGKNALLVKARVLPNAEAKLVSEKTLGLALEANSIAGVEGATITTDGVKFPSSGSVFTVANLVQAAQPANEDPPAGSPPAEGGDFTGVINALPLETPATINVPAGDQVLTEVFKFRITTAPEKSVKSISLNIKNQDNAVDISSLNYALFDTGVNPPMPNPFVTVVAETNKLTFSYGAPGILPTGHEMTLKVSVKRDFVGTMNGKKLSIGFIRLNNVALHGDDEFIPETEGQAFELWSPTYTFVDENGPPPPPVEPQECSEENPCQHQIEVDEVAPRTLPAGNDTPTAVFGFNISASKDTTLGAITVSLDNTIENPAPGTRLQASLVQVFDNGNEQVLSEAVGPTNDTRDAFRFSGLVRTLFKDRVAHFLIKVKILEDAQIVTPQNFKFTIKNASDVVLARFNRVEMADPISGNLMSIALPEAPPQEVNCLENEHLDAATNSCVANDPPVDPPAACPEGQERDAQGVCVVTGDQVQDMCPNVQGIQNPIPETMRLALNGECIQNTVFTDQCVNIPDMQIDVPAGMTKDAAGNCSNIVVGGEQYQCSAINQFNYEGLPRPDIAQGSCIPCPTPLFIQTNGSCIDTRLASGSGSDDETAGSQDSGSVRGSGRGSAFDGGFDGTISGGANLAGSQRLVRAPERGNTGPGMIIYLITGGLAPALAYGVRRLRK